MTTSSSSTVETDEGPSRVRRRVLWVTKGLGRGGAERLTVDCARSFDRSRWTIDVAYVLPHKNGLVDDLRTAGISVRCLGGGTSRVGWISALARLVGAADYDLVHTHSPVPAVVVRMMPVRWRPPVVHTEHNVWARYHPLTRTANALTFARNAGALAVSDGVAASVRNLFGAPRPVTLHHGLDVSVARHGTEERRAARSRLGLPYEVPVVGTVANFTPKKDHATLLRAVARAIEAHPSLRLVLVGSGPLEGAMRDHVHRLDIDHAVTFAGSRNDVPEVLPAFDIFALSSRYEGLPIALLEAMASGVPPIATAVGGVPEVISDGLDGLLVPAGDQRALGDAMTDLLDEPGRRAAVADRARRRAADFDVTRAVRRMEQWYEEILA